MTPDLAPLDRDHLERAVEIADRGWGRVHPNPRVGCVIARGVEVVAEGWHAEYGGPHAEVVALRAAGEAARGATAYVSLEPCRHRGKTPPCTEALLAAGISRVVYGAADPGEKAGGGGAMLRAAGIEVVGPVFDAHRARALNPAFHHRAHHDRPWLALKLALSLDGGIAARPGEATRLTGAEAEAAVHRLRAGVDGVVVGAATARVDDPRLTVRRGPPPRVPPARIVVDPRATVSPGAALFRDPGGGEVWIFVGPEAPAEAVAALERAGARVARVAATSAHALDLTEVVARCGAWGASALLCEGGGRLGAALARADLVDRLHLFVAPRFLGPQAVPAFPDWPGQVPSPSDPASPPPLQWRPVAHPRLRGVDMEVAFDRIREYD